MVIADKVREADADLEATLDWRREGLFCRLELSNAAETTHPAHD